MTTKVFSSYVRRANQRGISSIIIVFVLMILVTLISLGFAKLMSRALQGSLTHQQSAAAQYAAQSGIRNVTAWVKAKVNASEEIPLVTDCNKLLNEEDGEFRDVSILSPDGLTKYTCILLNPAPTSLRYDNLEPGKSNVIKIDSSVDKLMFSWQNYTGETKNFPDVDSKLLDESTWNSHNTHYPPLLRVTIYPIAAQGKLDDTQQNSRTYFFYPLPRDGNKNDVTEVDYGDNNYKRQPLPVRCNQTDVGERFVGSAELACNVIINNLYSQDAQTLYVRITPLYTQAKIVIKANAPGGEVIIFPGNQVIVDVSAKSGNSVKRLQARVSANISGDTILPDDDGIPEHAIRSAVTICKRLLVPEGAAPVSIELGSRTDCPVKVK